MAASVSPSSRGLATVRTSKGLFLIFSLLSLVYVTTSQTSNLDKLNVMMEQLSLSKVCSWKYLELMQEYHQAASVDLIINKAAHKRRVETVSAEFDETIDHLNSILKLVGEVSDGSALKEEMQDFVDRTITYTKQKMMNYTEQLHNNEKRLQEIQKTITEIIEDA